MKSTMFKRGFNAVKEEETRREKIKEMKKGRLFRFYVPKDKKTGKSVSDIPVIFLTEEPINYWEHTIAQGGDRFAQVPCTGDGCEYCQLDKNQGGKPRFVSAWLIVDRTEYSYTDQKGNTVEGKDRIKLLVRGMTDAAILENKSVKFGLMNYDWTVTKVGTGTSSSMQFERGDKLVLTAKQLESIMNQLPENMRGLDPYEIVEKQIMGEAEDVDVQVEDNGEDASDVEDKVLSGVQSLEDDEEEAPVKQKVKLPKKPVR